MKNTCWIIILTLAMGLSGCALEPRSKPPEHGLAGDGWAPPCGQRPDMPCP